MTLTARTDGNPDERERPRTLRIEMKGEQLPPAFYSRGVMFPRIQLTDACRGTLHGLTFHPSGQEPAAKKQPTSKESTRPDECAGWWHVDVPWFLQYLVVHNRAQHALWLDWFEEKKVFSTEKHVIIVHPDFCR